MEAEEVTDEWVFVIPNKRRVRNSHGPAGKGHLALFLDEGALDPKSPVHHISENVAMAKHVMYWRFRVQSSFIQKQVAGYVKEWKAESTKRLGETIRPLCGIKAGLVLPCVPLSHACTCSKIQPQHSIAVQLSVTLL